MRALFLVGLLVILGGAMGSPAIPVEQIEIKQKAYADLFYFARNVLGYNLLDDIHRDLCAFLQNGTNDALILEPRDHFKTTCLISYVCWRIVREPDIKILYSHKTLSKSRDILTEIKGHFERGQVFRYLFGDLRGKPWGEAAICVNKRTRIWKEPTISIGAVDHEIISGHYNLIINDDIAGLEDMTSEAARESTLRYYKSQRYLRDGRACKEITIGTRWAHTDVYDHILRNRPDVDKRIKTARLADGTPYFKSRYTNEKLQALEREDPIMFSAQMLNEPVSMLGNLYGADKLQYFAYTDVFKGAHNIAYIDPAFGKTIGRTNEPCYFCMCIGTLIDGRLNVVEWITNRDSPEQNEMMIVEKAREWKLAELAIESNAAQTEFCRNVRRTFDEQGLTLGITEIKHTTDKDRRIQSMHGTVKEKVFFRSDWREAYPEAMQQLTLYPQARFVDAPDALAGLIEIARLQEDTCNWDTLGGINVQERT